MRVLAFSTALATVMRASAAPECDNPPIAPSLPPGTRLGAYEIVGPIGAGGMGEVYRARDGRLERDVAIKVLPAELVADASRVSRFLQEARAASALNHPHVIAVYDIGEAESLRFIAMELVDGATLRDLTANGPLERRKAVKIVPFRLRERITSC